jgi:hypothetical protein
MPLPTHCINEAMSYPFPKDETTVITCDMEVTIEL